MALANSGLDDPVTILRSLYMNRPALRAKEHLRLYILAAVAGRKAALYCQAAESRRKALLSAPDAREQRVAGMEGLEPSNDGIKIRCLTAWLHPNKKIMLQKNIDAGKGLRRRLGSRWFSKKTSYA